MNRTAEDRPRKRVLLLAYACSPFRGSEPETGWRRALAVSKNYETWVLCAQREFQPNVERYIAEHGEIPNLHFCFVPGDSFNIPLLSSIRPLGYLAYNLWHRRAYKVARELHEKLRFDVIHQANLCGFREPGYLWRLDAPFIWGPVGGTQNYPFRFLTHAGFKGALIEGTRGLLNRLQFRFSPRVRRAARSAEVLLAANPVGERDFEAVHGIRPTSMLDVGVVGVDAIPAEIPVEDRPLRLLWSGRFEHRKALHLLLHALAGVQANYELRILGRGPLEMQWRGLARRLGIESRCKFMGFLPHPEAMAQYDWADLFVFTSLRDTFGTVVLESLSRGLPVICLDHQGAGAVVTEDCGVKIPVTTPGRVIDALADTVVALSGDYPRLRALSEGAILRASQYLWEDCGERLREVYEDVLRRHAEAPAALRPEREEDAVRSRA